jgi:hypothetical protein
MGWLQWPLPRGRARSDTIAQASHWTHVGAIVNGLTHFPPVFAAHRGIREALGVYIPFHFRPVLAPAVCCLLPKIVVLDHPGRPAVLSTRFGYSGEVCKQ